MDDAALLARFMAEHARLLARIAAQVAGVWDGLGSYDRPDVERFVTTVVPLVEANQVAAGVLVDGFVARMVQASPVGVLPEAVTGLRVGVTPAEVYERPFLRLWKQMGDGKPPEVARHVSRSYLTSIAQQDAQLAVSHAMADVTERQPSVVGYRRVLTGKSCRFCASASTQRYKAGSLRPLHSGCDCGVAPIIGDRDPGRVINRQLLARLQAQGPAYWKARGFVNADGDPIEPTRPGRVRTDRNAEIGPVIVTA